MEQQTSSKSGKEYVKSVYYHSAYKTYMQSKSWETLGWREAQAEIQIAGRNINTSDMQMTPRLWKKVKKN